LAASFAELRGALLVQRVQQRTHAVLFCFLGRPSPEASQPLWSQMSAWAGQSYDWQKEKNRGISAGVFIFFLSFILFYLKNQQQKLLKTTKPTLNLDLALALSINSKQFGWGAHHI
jgi:hypothetical protein